MAVNQHLLHPPVGNTDYCNAGCINSWLGDRYCDMVHLLYKPSPKHPPLPSSSLTLSLLLPACLPPPLPSLPSSLPSLSSFPLSPPSPSTSSHSHVGSQAVATMLVTVARTIGKNFSVSRSDFELPPMMTFIFIIHLSTSLG